MASFDPTARGDALDEHTFALANAESVRYRDVVSLQRCLDECSGGVVWESAHVLVRYFLEGAHPRPLGLAATICELGAGCGLLGLALARYMSPRPNRVVLTEAAPALEHLRSNVMHNGEQNWPADVTKPDVMLLDWLDEASVAPLRPPFDCIIGTGRMCLCHGSSAQASRARSYTHSQR